MKYLLLILLVGISGCVSTPVYRPMIGDYVIYKDGPYRRGATVSGITEDLQYFQTEEDTRWQSSLVIDSLITAEKRKFLNPKQAKPNDTRWENEQLGISK